MRFQKVAEGRLDRVIEPAVLTKRNSYVDWVVYVNLKETVAKRGNAKFGHKHNNNRTKHWRNKTTWTVVCGLLEYIPRT